jgi:ribosomal protein S18 acetylase RimI-like enzyme
VDAAPLDNPVWHALTTRHVAVAEGEGHARRYQPDVSVFWGVDALDAGGWAALAALAGPGRGVVLARSDVGELPDGWTMLGGGVGLQMVAGGLTAVGPGAPPRPEVRPLGPDDVGAMLELVALTEPGPFEARTIELGDYFGVMDGDRLVAMAGERMRFPGYTEISAVCTHPDARGRGLASRLTRRVADGIRDRGETPVLHVRRDNEAARRVYERLGFSVRRTIEFRWLRAPG